MPVGLKPERGLPTALSRLAGRLTEALQPSCGQSPLSSANLVNRIPKIKGDFKTKACAAKPEHRGRPFPSQVTWRLDTPMRSATCDQQSPRELGTPLQVASKTTLSSSLLADTASCPHLNPLGQGWGGGAGRSEDQWAPQDTEDPLLERGAQVSLAEHVG